MVVRNIFACCILTGRRREVFSTAPMDLNCSDSAVEAKEEEEDDGDEKEKINRIEEKMNSTPVKQEESFEVKNSLILLTM